MPTVPSIVIDLLMLRTEGVLDLQLTKLDEDDGRGVSVPPIDAVVVTFRVLHHEAYGRNFVQHA